MSVVSAAHPVEIWDVSSGRQRGTIDVVPGTISADFLSDREIVATTTTGAVTVFDLSVDDWITRACRAAGRDITEDEWAQFLPAHPYQQVCAPTR